MGDSDPEGKKAMNCSIQGCPGEYEARRITHTVRHRGRIVVIDHVPAEVCPICGDVLLTAETVRHIEALLQDSPEPSRTIPLYEYA
jgi:HTH-type transcriptional regulator / antitoxin MqsA